jgi:hypothetical protein
VHRLGDRAARVEVRGDPLSRYCGALIRIIEKLCEKPLLMEISERRGPTTFAFLVRW